jgi:hypothetical protein
MSETESDKWRKWILDLVKMALPAILAWYTTNHFNQQVIARKEGALDTCNGVVYTGQSPEYYEGFHEQLQQQAEEPKEVP